jgi:four helix bundle protein
MIDFNVQITMYNVQIGEENMSVILVKSKSFAIRTILLYKYLRDNKKEFILSKQILKSGTSIGANIREAHHGQSKKDFIAKMNIALKEAAETEYWLELLHETDYIDTKMFDSVYKDCNELNKLLISIIKTSNK